MLHRPFIFIIAVAFFVAGCKTKPADSPFIERIDFGDSIKKFANPNRIRFSYNEKVAYALNLDSIVNGYNDLQLRIWLGHLMAMKKNIVILKYQDKKWRGELITYSVIDPHRFDMTVKIHDYKNIIPKSGWKNFLKSYEWNSIQKFLNTGDSVHCCGDGGTDGIVYDFEIATKNEYHEYYYSNPTDDSANNILAKDILLFADLLEKEFAFKYTK